MTEAQQGWQIVLKSEGETLELQVYDVIGSDFFFEGVTAKAILAKLRAAPKATKIVLRINSVGGVVDDAKAMVNLLRERAAAGVEIEARVDGLAASAAGYLTTAADHVVMPSNTFLMIHGVRSARRGTAEDFEAAAELLKTINGQIADAYAEASKRRGKKKTRADYMALMASGDHYLTADEAIEWGLADETDEAVKVAACAVDISSLSEPPEALLGMPYVLPPKKPEPAPAAPVAAVLEPSTATPAVAQAEPEPSGGTMTEPKIETKEQPKPAPAAAAAEPQGFVAILGVSSEAEGIAKVRELQNSALAILAATGKASIAEAMPVLGEWKLKAEQSDRLTKHVAQLTEESRIAKRDAAIEKLSREGGLPPSRHEWARMQFATAEAVETFCVGMPKGFWGSVTEPTEATANLTLTDEQKKVCAVLGMSEKDYLEQLKLERSRPVPPAGA